MSKILITGGAGFIGGVFSRFLLSCGYSVSIIDFPEKKQKFESQNGFDKIAFYGFDLSDQIWIDKLPNDFDYVYHIAAQSGGYGSLINPQKDCLWNCLSTANVVEFCKKIKPQKLVYTSTMAVYGEGHDKDEKSPLVPKSYYGVSKLSGEYYVSMLHRHCGVNYTIYRLFNTYGFGQDLSNMHQGMLSIYLAQALNGNAIEIKGSKHRTRDFVDVRDVCSALYMSLENKNTDNDIFNVCNGMAYSVEEVINKISKSLKKNLEIKEVDPYLGDQFYSSGNCSKLKSLGWTPKYSIDDGINDFVEGIHHA